MSDLVVDVVTPERVVFSGPAHEARVPGVAGEFGVLPGHANFLSLLRAGVATLVTPDGTKRFVIGRGFAEAGPERLVILTDLYDSGEGIDRAKAQKELDEAQLAMAATAADSEERLQAEQAAELARARLDF
jgi:F-type H+-transporting ATPase subunit epsilon